MWHGDDLTKRLELAVEAARSAGEITLRYFNRLGLSIKTKKDGTPVTEADREAEAHLRQRITEKFPADGIVGEEFGDRSGTSGFRWILDPIDGTKSFIHGVPLYGTLVGIEHDRRSVGGVIMIPALDECVYAAEGQGAWHLDRTNRSSEPRRAKVSAVAHLSESLFCTTSVSTFIQKGRGPAFEAMRSACKLTRGWGDCYGYLLVATGRAEVMVDPALALWDMAALPVILSEAGGRFTNWQGEPTIYGTDSVGSNGLVHEQVLDLTRGR